MTSFGLDFINIDDKNGSRYYEIMKIAIRQSQKINSRIRNLRIAIRQRIAQLGFVNRKFVSMSVNITNKKEALWKQLRLFDESPESFCFSDSSF